MLFPFSSVILHHHPEFFGNLTLQDSRDSLTVHQAFLLHITILKLSTSHPWAKSSYLVQYPASLQEEHTNHIYTRDTSDPIHGQKSQNRTQVCINIQSETFWDCCQSRNNHKNRFIHKRNYPSSAGGLLVPVS